MNTESLPEKLILASSSKYRKELLKRLGIPFDCRTPHINETPLPDELPGALVKRLAIQKAQAIGKKKPHAVVIGSDQVAVFNQQIIGKPGSHHDYVDAEDFPACWTNLHITIEVEAKAKELAVLKLKQDLINRIYKNR